MGSKGSRAAAGGTEASLSMRCWRMLLEPFDELGVLGGGGGGGGVGVVRGRRVVREGKSRKVDVLEQGPDREGRW